MKVLPFGSLISTVLCAVLVVSPVYAQAPAIAAATDVPEALQIRVIDTDQIQSTSRTGSKQTIQVVVTDSSGAGVANAAVTCRLPETGPTGTFNDGTHAAVAYTDAQGHATIESVQWGEVPGTVSMRLTATKGSVHTGILVDTDLHAGASPAAVGPKADAITAPRETTTVIVPVPTTNAPPASDPQMPIGPPTVSVTKPGSKAVPQPGEVAAAKTAVANPSPDKLTPVAVESSVSVSRTSAADAPHSSHAKWYVLAAVAVAAAAGAGFAMKGKSSTAATTSSATISIGTPTVSVGH